MDEACPFCRPDADRILLLEDLAYAYWDAYPVSPGHLLVVPRRHVASWFETTDAEREAILRLLDRAREHVVAHRGTDAFNVGINVGEIAGQTVSHAHVHLIPRYENDVPNPRGGVRHVLPDRADYLAVRPAGIDLLQGPRSRSALVQGADDPLLPHLRACLDRAQRADFAVAFVLKSGVELIREHLRDLLGRGGRVRILTGDYLDATDPDALVELLDLEGDLRLRAFETTERSFHPKAYLFFDRDGHGTAFVGSSNLTRPALQEGVEWNFRVLRDTAGRGFAEVAGAFDALFEHPSTRAVDADWIDAYRRRRAPLFPWRRAPVPDVDVETPLPPPEPHAIQKEALQALQKSRAAGNKAGLVVLATGLGKTWLAAFDSAQAEFRRVLFVAHREEILSQAMQTFRRIRPQARLGRYTGTEKAPDSDVLFASIQTLGRARHLELFQRDRFDYVVVDEFHHAAARTYRQLIEHFVPRFLLGLTATPERTDGGDLLTLCQGNLVYRRDLTEGIQAGLLSPFRYFGVPDDVDYANIPWRSSRFDEEELTNAVATRRRAQNALEQLRSRGGKRALGFCCSQRHADFMADYFNEQGVRAAAVHAGERSAPRASALEALAEGTLDILFAVDMFNEGLDLPNVDTALMLRPTESSVIWLQQFGRGLRRAEGKDELKVIDYIGNHRTFLVKVRTLLQPFMGAVESDAEIAAAMRLLQEGSAELPPGCHVTYDLQVVDIVQALLRFRAADDAIRAFYEDFRQRHGMRPTAVELYRSGYNPRSLRKTHGSWTKFLRSSNGLTETELGALEAAGDFLDALETTPMTKSFKMVALAAMLNRDSLPGRLSIDDLTHEFGSVASRTRALRDDVGSAIDDETALRRLVESNPVAAWSGGKGTDGKAYFRFEGGEFATDFSSPDEYRDSLQDLVRELVDWRLAEYLDRDAPEGDGFACRVIHAGGRPILKLPDRKRTEGVPFGWVEAIADGMPYTANFAKEFVNVLRRERDEETNVLPELLRGWFGPDAGLPGTRAEVRFEPTEAGWRMEPVVRGGPATPRIWSHYKREDIPPLFGLTFNQAIWNQGFVVLEDRVFLLVTLEKGGLNKDHRYEDRFLSPERFAWQSQNKTAQEGKHGRLIRDHREAGAEVHLFVRKRKVIDGKAAPFVYCGTVDFVSWEGDRPISVVWNLREPVPPAIREELAVPGEPG